MNKNIAMVINPGMLKAEGGIGRYVRALNDGMPKNIHRIKLPNGMLSNIFFKVNVDSIIHLTSPMAFFPLVIKNPHLTIISTAFDYMPTSYLASHENSIKRFWNRRLADLRITLNSDYLIAISTKTRDEAMKLGFDKKNIRVINLGLDKQFFKPIKRKPDRTFKIGYIGSFPPRKNVSFAIDAIRMMKGVDIRFKLYGEMQPAYESILDTMDERMHFYGLQKDENLPAIYDSFDVFVYPSLNEGFGLPILEAQARGVPVVICKDAKIPKEVREFCFEAKDEGHMADILTIIKENGFDKYQSMQMIAHARSFTWKKNLAETLKFYDEVSQ